MGRYDTVTNLVPHASLTLPIFSFDLRASDLDTRELCRTYWLAEHYRHEFIQTTPQSIHVLLELTQAQCLGMTSVLSENGRLNDGSIVQEVSSSIFPKIYARSLLLDLSLSGRGYV
jgi:hypothetical protein